MSTLWRRANGPQYRMLKIVKGAVLNAAHHHPGHPVDSKFARGVAKRAVGTISAGWPELLAADRLPPSGAGMDNTAIHSSNGAQLVKPRGGRRQIITAGPRFRKTIVREISRLIGPARKAGDLARVGALVEVMRIIDRAVKGGAT